MRHVLATAAAILRDPKPAHVPARTQVPFPPAWPRDRVIPLADVEYASEAERECVLAGRNPMGSVWTEKPTSSDLDAVNAAVASTLCAPGGVLAVMGPEAARYVAVCATNLNLNFELRRRPAVDSRAVHTQHSVKERWEH